ncbi:hypothetical protein JCM30237_30660 [Halolamina litorea]|uniref:Uncharacterized protein n=1 Tax=Halolamina litorea TaxID=1515593 RepID=A0ABD6BNV5_9EURY|nr:hypothetical protein [Halolamina litorea]
MAELHAELFCDPLSVAGWRHRSTLKRVAYTYPELTWTLRPTVAFPDPLEGEAAATYAADARRAADAAGLPVEAEPLKAGVPASWVACEALVAARAMDPAGAMELYHRLNAASFAGGSPPSSADAVADVGTEIDGLDADEIRAAIGSRRTTAGLGRDLAIGEAMFDRLDEHEVRGTPGRLRLDARLLGDGASAPDGDEAEADNTDDDAEGENGDGETADDTSDTPEPASVPAPPVVRLTAGRYTVVIDLSQGFQEFADVLGRYDPDMGRDLWREGRYGRKVIQAYGLGQRTAENLSGEDFSEKSRRVLDAVGESFVADVAACSTLDPDTCRIALRQLGAAGGAERGPSGGWRPTPNRED